MKLQEVLERLNALPLDSEVVLSVWDHQDPDESYLAETEINMIDFDPKLNKITIVEA